MIRDHPPPFCLFFSLLTSLKAAWTSGEPFGRPALHLVGLFSLFSFWRIRADRVHSRAERRTFPLLFLFLFVFFPLRSCVSWSRCGKHLLSPQQRGKKNNNTSTAPSFTCAKILTRTSEWNKFGKKKGGGEKAQEWMFHDGMTDNETMS